ncbi:TIGR01244 family sulfur transferase [Shimia biformata]|uniref:TIGR01244 family sulfur transferase n=1 Tax=Shimia biformata TaxID=1294299 RepID=UPI00194DC362|nr:TIGR01244 family sulfur transferase [Shimia biformata]
MDIRQISPSYFVSPQIDPADIAAIKAAGFTRIICNRPDAEIPPSHHASVMADLAAAEGIDFVAIPLTHDTMNAENLGRQKDAMDSADGKVLAYCASGTRCTVAWSLIHAAEMPVDDILGAAAAGGYDLGGLRPRLEALAQG